MHNIAEVSHSPYSRGISFTIQQRYLIHHIAEVSHSQYSRGISFTTLIV